MQLLIVEDHRDLALSLTEGLRAEGYAVDAVHDGQAALIYLAEHDVDLMILDRDLPILSGDTLCRLLRAEGHPVPILMLTAAAGIDDRVTGLDLGADDYLPKPFAYPELLARIRARTRRLAPAAAKLAAGRIVIDPERHTTLCDGTLLRLAPKEQYLLEALCRVPGTLVTTNELLAEVWGNEERSRGVVKLTVHTLRKRLAFIDPSASDAIVSVPGRGYCLEIT